jgi:hypothetical protein
MLDAMSVLVATELVVAVRTLRIAAERQPAPACGRASTPPRWSCPPASRTGRSAGRRAVRTAVRNFAGVKVRG